MNFKRKFTAIICCIAAFALALLFACCGKPSGEGDLGDGTPSVIPDDAFTERDMDFSYDEKSAVKITLKGNTAECSSRAVSVSGNTVTLTQKGTYMVSGSLDGSLAVDAGKTDKVQIVLCGANISCSGGAALYVKKADKVFVTLKEGTSNSLKSTGAFAQSGDDNVDGAVFSKADITFNGKGSLEVGCATAHGIVSKDDLVVTGGKYTVTAAKQALSGKDCIKIAAGEFTLDSGGDGLHSENADDSSLGYIYIAGGTFGIRAGGDGIDASKDVRAGGGTLKINADGKGIKGSGGVSASGGKFEIDSSDDALHSNADITVSGGEWKISTEDDALHADETLEVSGGVIVANKCHEGLEGKNIVVSGGEITIVSDDDGINAAGGRDMSGAGGSWGDPWNGGGAQDASITVSGGKIVINALGDGIDSNGSLYITGGEVYVTGPSSSMDAPIDFDGVGTVSGGRIVAVGSRGMAQNFGSASTQGSVLVGVQTAARGKVALKDGEGVTLMEFTPERDLSYTAALVSVPELKKGERYTLSLGSLSLDVTMTSLIYTSGIGGMGGRQW